MDPQSSSQDLQIFKSLTRLSNKWIFGSVNLQAFESLSRQFRASNYWNFNFANFRLLSHRVFGSLTLRIFDPLGLVLFSQLDIKALILRVFGPSTMKLKVRILAFLRIFNSSNLWINQDTQANYSDKHNISSDFLCESTLRDHSTKLYNQVQIHIMSCCPLAKHILLVTITT